MQLMGTIYFAKRANRAMWMAMRVSRPTWQTAIKRNHPGQEEEPI
jgi:hypothetical protein